MNAKELRIGNLFYLPNGNIGIISYHEIRLLTVAIDKPNYKPIPITNELLEKLGFRVGNGNGSTCAEIAMKNGRYFVMDKIQNWGHDFYYTQGEGIQLSVPIKYVHQLQNLVFAITGEDLVYTI